MKSLKTFAFAFAVCMTLSISAFATISPKSKIVVIAQEAVANAGTNDWITLAQSADICLNQEENLKQANKWIDKSLSIEENSYNLKLKGDLLQKQGKNAEAMNYYLKAIEKGKESNPFMNTEAIQTEIWKVRSRLINS